MMEILDNKRDTCIFCGEDTVHKLGLITVVGGNKKQRYKCTTCGKTFY